MEQRRILIAEDDEAIRELLADLLRSAGYAVHTAADGRAALESLLSYPPDLALLDVNMPEIDGFRLLKMMARECPGTPSIILTAHGEEKERVKGLELGADDYVVKPFSSAELLARIAAVLRRSVGRQLPITRQLQFPGGSMDGAARNITTDGGDTIALTEKEFELFRYFLTHPNRILPQEELMLRVWGNRGGLGRSRTIAVTLTRLRDKLPPEAAQRFENIRGRGYRWNEV